MKPSITLAATTTPSGSNLECISHDKDIYLYLDRQPICSTRACEPELALARAGGARISIYRTPSILLAGLGLGQCLHEMLTLAPDKAMIHLSEPLKVLIEWHRDLLGDDYRMALQDHRLTVHTTSITSTIKQTDRKFDIILISTDPALTTASVNALRACVANLNPKGMICIKSLRENAARIRSTLEGSRLHTSITSVGARPEARTRTHAIICAARKSEFLPHQD